jgi:hypothetical protein
MDEAAHSIGLVSTIAAVPDIIDLAEDCFRFCHASEQSIDRGDGALTGERGRGAEGGRPLRAATDSRGISALISTGHTRRGGLIVANAPATTATRRS